MWRQIVAARHATATPWVVQHPKGVTVKLGREAAPWAVTGRLSCNANKSKAGVQTTGAASREQARQPQGQQPRYGVWGKDLHLA